MKLDTETNHNILPHRNVKILDQIIAFLNETGIKVSEAELDDDCFLPGLFPKGCGLLLDRKRLKYPGDLLHEAGHIAVTEAHLRPLIGTSEMLEQWPRPGDELGAILWSYAAACRLKIPLNVVFHPDGYKGDANWLIEQFELGNYIGLPLLTWMGFCNTKEDPQSNTSFPAMLKWLR
ncbi:MAG: hypothetical protein ACK5M7_14700 [Draconibacterium sp.]